MNREMEWPAGYYQIQDAEKRKKLLDEHFASGEADEADEIRRKLWTARYGLRGKDRPGTDYFMRAWVNLSFLSERMGSVFGYGRRKKEMEQLKKELCLEYPAVYGDVGREVLYREIYHLMAFVIEIDMGDKNYGNIFLGLGKMSDKTLKEKIANDFIRIIRQLSAAMDMKEDFSLLDQAATEAYCAAFPEEQQQIL